MEKALADLDASRQSLLALLAQCRLDQVVNAASKTRVRDVLCHIAQWERNASAAIDAAALGGTFVIAPFDIDAINARIRDQHQRLTEAQVLTLLAETRSQLQRALQARDPETLVMLPWGRQESLAHIAKDMHGHELHHAAQLHALLDRP